MIGQQIAHLGGHRVLHVAAQRLRVRGNMQQRVQNCKALRRAERLVALALQSESQGVSFRNAAMGGERTRPVCNSDNK